MLQPSTLSFLKSIKKNNNREWFEKNRDKYESAKADFDKLIADIINEVSKVNKNVAGLLPKDCVHRIYRDVRFSKNKDPYKSNFAAAIIEGGRKSGKCGFYIHVEPTGQMGSLFAGGFWMPEGDKLKAIRQEIHYNTAEFKRIISNKDFKKQFGELEEMKLKTVPKGYDKNDPDIELYKYTSYIVSHDLDEADYTKPSIVKKAADAYKALLPFINFLNRAVS